MYNPDVHHRSSIRLKGHDYSSGRYFITISLSGRMPLFGTIEHECVVKNDAGEMVEKTWTDSVLRFPNIILDAYIVMPDHFHGIIDLGGRYDKVYELGDIIAYFKSYTTLEYIKGVRNMKWTGFEHRLWQRNYYECIIMNEAELMEYKKYILNNPSEVHETTFTNYNLNHLN